ncbi:MAG TPA: hypothetical protein VH413_16045 [Verrucomicrobiae bacterium]|nr:hypothetical protein [Verrucomicrobiae bacterium]
MSDAPSIAQLRQNVVQLERQLEQIIKRGEGSGEPDHESLQRTRRELEEARQSVTDWHISHDGRN